MQNNLNSSLSFPLAGVALALIAAFGPTMQGASVTLAWDRSPDSSVTGYRLHYGAATRQYTNAVPVGNVTTTNVSGLLDGITYYFAVTACTSNQLESDFSNEVNYRGGTATNTAPVANAGADQTITLPSGATLAGTVSDDGLPTPPGTTTATWSKVSGPGTVTFGNANPANTNQQRRR
jgi:fibronectin type 3 domain-containing protein